MKSFLESGKRFDIPGVGAAQRIYVAGLGGLTSYGQELTNFFFPGLYTRGDLNFWRVIEFPSVYCEENQITDKKGQRCSRYCKIYESWE
jgi:hypothetical protein